MSMHITAKVGEIADKILLPGDPQRAKYIAETYFTNPVCVNELRGAYCFTGEYKGQKVSVLGTGMGGADAMIDADNAIKTTGNYRKVSPLAVSITSARNPCSVRPVSVE